MPQTKIKVIVFDLDGTLVDSMNSFSEVASRVIHQYFNVEVPEATRLYKETSGLPFEFQLRKLFGDHDAIVAAVNDYETQKLKGYQNKTFYDDVIKTLPWFKKNGYKLCVSSNNHIENVIDKIKSQQGCFDLVLGYKEGFLKGRDHFEFIKKEFGLSADQILFVGDSLHDSKTAHENGIAFIARLGTFSENEFDRLGLPMRKINSFFELVGLLHIN